MSLIAGAICIAAPFVAARLEGTLPWLAESGRWRGILVPPTIIAYILLAAPYLANMESRVFASLRPLLDVDETALRQLAEETGGVTPGKDMAAFAVGAVLALALNVQGVIVGFSWLELILLLEAVLMYGMLGVVICASLAGTRVMNALLRLPLRIDPLDVTPFEAIGRQSLLLALVFVGGVTISLLFVGFPPEILRQWELHVIYVPLIIVPLLVFFLNMVPTHRCLRAARDRELRRVQSLIRQECSVLVQRMEQGEEAAPVAQRLPALAAYESRLLEARTRPYNTTMLRAAFVSVLIPGGTMISRIVVELLKR